MLHNLYRQGGDQMDTRRRVSLLFSLMVLLFLAALNPPSVLAVPSYARQTGLACSGCHYTPPELNPAGRRFKLLGYVDKGDDTKTVKADGGKKRALDLLSSLPLSVMLDTSFTSTKSPIPTTQNGSFEFPQDISLFLSGAWTSNIGSFLQVTYDTQNDHFTSDNTDIRYANTRKCRTGRARVGNDSRTGLTSAAYLFSNTTTYWLPLMCSRSDILRNPLPSISRTRSGSSSRMCFTASPPGMAFGRL